MFRKVIKMYGIVVQREDNLMVEKVIACDTLKEVQEELDVLVPKMDWEYLLNGDLASITADDRIYHLGPIYANTTTKQTANS